MLDLDQPGLGMAREYLMKGVEDNDVKVGKNTLNTRLFIKKDSDRLSMLLN